MPFIFTELDVNSLLKYCAVSPRFPGEGDDEDPVTENHSVIRGGSIFLRCLAHALPEPQITWYKNGEELTDELDDEDDRIRYNYTS